MAKPTSVYVCSKCGHEHSRWQGKCDSCKEWNSLTSFNIKPTKNKARPYIRTILTDNQVQIHGLDSFAEAPDRIVSSVNEFDRVCGGGIVPGSVILLSGEPGVGKSTLLLRLLTSFKQRVCENRGSKTILDKESKEGFPVLYICGEESPHQIQLRADRLNITSSILKLTSEKELTLLQRALDKLHFPIIAVDSIQTVWIDGCDGAPGSVLQIRATTQFWIEEARKRKSVVILVGHVTKEGNIAGPKVMEHMVDVVLNLESEHGHNFRLLRALKNRFGSCAEVGVFNMTSTGLEEVNNPSSLFISSQRPETAGNAIYAGMEGSRPLLLEIQALVASSKIPQPRRSCVGFDHNRLAMILAVCERHLHIQFSKSDIYLNVTGGYKLSDPAADTAVVAALISAWHNIVLPSSLVLFGEIGLGGEIRQVKNYEARIKEAEKLNFKQSISPNIASKSFAKPKKLHIINVSHISNLYSELKKFSTQKTSILQNN